MLWVNLCLASHLTTPTLLLQLLDSDLAWSHQHRPSTALGWAMHSAATLQGGTATHCSLLPSHSRWLIQLLFSLTASCAGLPKRHWSRVTSHQTKTIKIWSSADCQTESTRQLARGRAARQQFPEAALNARSKNMALATNLARTQSEWNNCSVHSMFA